MKKVLAILCSMGLLLGLASMAVATPNPETDWGILLRGSSTNFGYNAAGPIICGTKTGATDGYDSGTDKYYTANSGFQAQVAVYEPTWWQISAPKFISLDYRAPIGSSSSNTKNYLKEWSLRFWVGKSYDKSEARLSWLEVNGTSFAAAPSTIQGHPYNYYLRIDHDPTGTYADGWLFEIPSNCTTGINGGTAGSTNPIGFLDFSNIGVIKLSDVDAQAKGVCLTLIAIPEPGSFVALGSGLVGLLGFAAKKRRK